DFAAQGSSFFFGLAAAAASVQRIVSVFSGPISASLVWNENSSPLGPLLRLRAQRIGVLTMPLMPRSPSSASTTSASSSNPDDPFVPVSKFFPKWATPTNRERV